MLKGIAIRNVLSFEDTYIKRGADLKQERFIPISDTVTIFTGKNNSGKTNLLKCINWLHAGLPDPVTSVTYDGGSECQLTGVYELDDGDLEKIVSAPVANERLKDLQKVFADVRNLEKEIALLSSPSGDITENFNRLNTEMNSVKEHWPGFEKQLSRVDVQELDPEYCQLTLNGKNERVLWLTPLKNWMVLVLSRLHVLVNEIYNGRRYISKDLKEIIEPAVRSLAEREMQLRSRIDVLSLSIQLPEPSQRDIESMFFRTRFIDETMNQPLSPWGNEAWHTPVGKAIAKMLGAEDKPRPHAVASVLNKIVNERIRKTRFPLLREFLFNFHCTGDQVAVTLFDERDRRFFTMQEVSLGIRWLLALWFQLYAEADSKPDLILIDEPGFNIHPGGQKELAFIMESVVKEFGSQIAFTTHSPFMINPNRMLDIRLVEEHVDNQKGTKYSVVNLKPYKEGYGPLCASLGLRFMKPYFLLERGSSYFVVEGESDAIILMTLSQLHVFHGLPGIDFEHVAFYPAGSAGVKEYCDAIKNVRYVCESAPIVLLMDGDKKGVDLLTKMKRQYPDATQKSHRVACVCLADSLTAPPEPTIEDLVPATDYVEAVRQFAGTLGKRDIAQAAGEYRGVAASGNVGILKGLSAFMKTKSLKFDRNTLSKVGLARTLMDHLLGLYGKKADPKSFKSSFGPSVGHFKKLADVLVSLATYDKESSDAQARQGQ